MKAASLTTKIISLVIVASIIPLILLGARLITVAEDTVVQHNDKMAAMGLAVDKEIPSKLVYEMKKEVITYSFYALFIVFLLGLFFARSITQPIKDLSNATERIARGDLSIELKKSDQDDEVGRLTNSFISMVNRLELAQKNLTESREYLQTLISSMDDGIMVINENHLIFDANPGAMKITGLDESEIIGSYCYKVLHNKEEPCCDEILPNGTKLCDSTDYVCPVRSAFQGNESGRTAIHTYVDQEGRTYSVDLYASPIRDSDGMVTQVVLVSRDFTKRQKLEKQLKDYTKQLEQSNKLKDLFTDILRHDLMNPIGIIKVYSEILLDDMEDKDIKNKERIAAINKNAQKLIEMIEDTTKLSKLESEEKLEFEKMDLNSIIKDVINELRYLLIEKDITVNYNGGDEYPAFVNPIINDVFLNLMTNAIKYSARGKEIIIDIKDAGEYWEVSVTDFGIGIKDEYKDMIFERFTRFNKGGVKGAGLGLAIVKRIIDLHHGKVWVEDNPEGGSIFYVNIPKDKQREINKDEL